VLLSFICVLCRGDLTGDERDHTIADLAREITALWKTDELRRQRPSPVDGRWGSHRRRLDV
jgi:phosphoenolpyruvate carboxylase